MRCATIRNDRISPLLMAPTKSKKSRGHCPQLARNENSVYILFTPVWAPLDLIIIIHNKIGKRVIEILIIINTERNFCHLFFLKKSPIILLIFLTYLSSPFILYYMRCKVFVSRIEIAFVRSDCCFYLFNVNRAEMIRDLVMWIIFRVVPR